MMTTETTYELGPWSLEDLFPGADSPELKAAFDSLEALVADFESRRAKLDAEVTAATVMGFVQDLNAITTILMRLFGFAGLRFYANTQDQEAAAFFSKIQQLNAQVQNRTLFFNLWWKGLEDEKAASLMAGAGEFAYFLQEMRNMKPFTLSEPEEKIVNIKNVTGRHALDILYDTITARYTYDLEVEGEMKTGLSRDALMQYVTEPDADLRARAYQTLYARYEDEAPVLGQIYQSLVHDWHSENVNLRGFRDPIAVRNLANDIPNELVDTLMEVTRRNAGLFQRYFKLKARWLGMERIRRYDIYAPVANSDKSFAYQEAVDMTLDAFGRFDEEVAGLVRRVIDKGHVDSELRPGKTGGAFCWGPVPEIDPWVLLNYAGKARDVSTMAHEMGHAIHSMLSSHLPILAAQSSLPLAETASTFSEMLLVDYLLERETDPGVRRDLLFRQMDDAFATILRQVFFALFERQAHDLIRNGATVNDLAAAYMENLQDQFGDAVEISDEFRWEWVSIPHIYGTPFYVYAYAFGQLLVLALYRQYQEEGEAFKPRYLEILSSGGSASPIEILTRAGIDVTTEAFWQGGFDRIEEMLQGLESIPIPE